MVSSLLRIGFQKIRCSPWLYYCRVQPAACWIKVRLEDAIPWILLRWGFLYAWHFILLPSGVVLQKVLGRFCWVIEFSHPFTSLLVPKNTTEQLVTSTKQNLVLSWHGSPGARVSSSAHWLTILTSETAFMAVSLYKHSSKKNQLFCFVTFLPSKFWCMPLFI